MRYTTGDEFEDDFKQHSLDVTFKNIKDMMLKGTDGDLVIEDLEDITPYDIDNYMEYLSTSKELAIKDGRIRFARIENTDLFYDVCDYMGITVNDIPLMGQQKIYFVDSGDFSSTVIPLQTEKNSTRILIQPFEDSPTQIQNLKWELDEGKRTKRSFEELKEDFDYRNTSK